MPIYDFKCEHCNKIEERIVSYSASENQFCDCKENAKMIKTDQIHNTSFALKGVWYKTHRNY